MENADDVDGKVEPDIIRGEEFAEAAAYVSSSMVTEPPKIALTFDDGPSSSWTPILLDVLKERGVKATFFLIGENAKKNPEKISYICFNLRRKNRLKLKIYTKSENYGN